MEELQDYICVSQQTENGDTRAVLFVKMRKGLKFTPKVEAKIRDTIDRELTDSFIPECILGVPDIPVSMIN